MSARKLSIEAAKPARKKPATPASKARAGAKRPAPEHRRSRPPYFTKLAYDVIETSDALGVSVPTVNRLIYAVPPQLQSMKIGARRVIPVSAITEYIERRLHAKAMKYLRA